MQLSKNSERKTTKHPLITGYLVSSTLRNTPIQTGEPSDPTKHFQVNSFGLVGGAGSRPHRRTRQAPYFTFFTLPHSSRGTTPRTAAPPPPAWSAAQTPSKPQSPSHPRGFPPHPSQAWAPNARSPLCPALVPATPPDRAPPPTGGCRCSAPARAPPPPEDARCTPPPPSRYRRYR